jgi:hypothetical protein
MENKGNGDKPKWTEDEQKKIDEALRKAELEEEIERKLREKRWSASGDDKGAQSKS